MCPYTDILKNFIMQGGVFYGTCMGAFLADGWKRDPINGIFKPGGFGFAEGFAWEYSGSPGSEVVWAYDVVTLKIDYRNTSRNIFYQGGPYIDLSESAK